MSKEKVVTAAETPAPEAGVVSVIKKPEAGLATSWRDAPKTSDMYLVGQERDTQQAHLAKMRKVVAKDPAVLEALVEKMLEPHKTGLHDLLGRIAAETMGMEEVDSKWYPSRLRLTQRSTYDKGKPDNAKAGDLYTSRGTKLNQPLELIPIYVNYTHNRWRADNTILCRAPDAKTGFDLDARKYLNCITCPHLPYRNQERTDCNKSIEAVFLLSDCSDVVTCSFAKTSFKAGADLIKFMKVTGPIAWTRSYSLRSKEVTGEKGVYFVTEVTPTGTDTPALIREVAAFFHAHVVASRVALIEELLLRSESNDSNPVSFDPGRDKSDSADLETPTL